MIQIKVPKLTYNDPESHNHRGVPVEALQSATIEEWRGGKNPIQADFVHQHSILLHGSYVPSLNHLSDSSSSPSNNNQSSR